jgi:hypothetical protein
MARTKRQTRPAKSAKAAKTARPSAKKAKSKKQTCLELLRRPKGASLAELQQATGWQAHSVRGFLSGTARKLADAKLETEVTGKGARRYRLVTSATKG